jgi:hypothetical protein
VQAEMIADLEAQAVPLLILRHRFPDDALDRELASQRRVLPRSGATALDDYIRAHFVPIERVGILEAWVRKERVRGMSEREPGPAGRS